jgi:hypothetical protein
MHRLNMSPWHVSMQNQHTHVSMQNQHTHVSMQNQHTHVSMQNQHTHVSMHNQHTHVQTNLTYDDVPNICRDTDMVRSTDVERKQAGGPRRLNMSFDSLYARTYVLRLVDQLYEKSHFTCTQCGIRKNSDTQLNSHYDAHYKRNTTSHQCRGLFVTINKWTRDVSEDTSKSKLIDISTEVNRIDSHIFINVHADAGSRTGAHAIDLERVKYDHIQCTYDENQQKCPACGEVFDDGELDESKRRVYWDDLLEEWRLKASERVPMTCLDIPTDMMHTQRTVDEKFNGHILHVRCYLMLLEN